jgi:predicted dehydrogenase
MAGDGAPVRVGVLGAGFVAGRHVERLLTLEGARVVAVADPDLRRAEALAGRAGARALATVEQLVDLGLDCLLVCVPPHQHGAPEELALEAGLPILVEKPLSGDRATAERLGRLFAERGHLAVVGYQWRHLDTWAVARDLLAGRAPRMVVGAWLDRAPRTPWWADQSCSGGQVVEQLTHVLDVARSLAGEAEVVGAAGAWDAAGPGDIAHVTASTLRFDTGAVGSFTSTCLLPGGYRIAVELIAPGLLVRLSERDLVVVDQDGERRLEAQVDPVRELDAAFLAAVRGEDGGVRTPYADALLTHRLAWDITEAVLAGTPHRTA